MKLQREWKWLVTMGLLPSALACGSQGEIEVELSAEPTDQGTLRQGIVDLGSGPQEVTYRVWNGLAIFEDDILLNVEELATNERLTAQGKRPLAARAAGFERWPNAVVPYDDTTLSATLKAEVAQAREHWQNKTPLHFVPRTTQTDYVKFELSASPGVCGLSHVGRRGGRQIISVINGCGVNSIIHEIGHAVGLYHEQSRADRNNFITVHLDQITDAFEYAFNTYVQDGTDGVDLGPYNFASIMHYHEDAFQCVGCTGHTITRDDGRPLNPSNIGLSMGDHLGVRTMYCDAISWDPTRCTQAMIPGDYNGDGRSDFALFDSRDNRVWVSTADSGPFTAFTTQAWSAPLDSAKEWTLFAKVNVGNDAHADLLALSDSGGSLQLFRSNGTSFAGPNLVSALSPGGWAAMRVGRFNNDNFDDVAIFNKVNATWWVALGTATGFGGFTMWADYSDGGWTQFVVGRFSPDGLDDLASFNEVNGTWWVGRSLGSGFTTTLWSQFQPGGWTTALAGDFTGDGLTDIANFNTGNATWWVSVSSGTGFSATMWADYSNGGWTNHVVGNFDTDNRADLASYNLNGTWWVARSTGTAFTNGANGQALASAASLVPTTGWASQVAADITGDGRTDLINYLRNGTISVVVTMPNLFFSAQPAAETCPGRPLGLCARLSD